MLCWGETVGLEWTPDKRPYHHSSDSVDPAEFMTCRVFKDLSYLFIITSELIRIQTIIRICFHVSFFGKNVQFKWCSIVFCLGVLNSLLHLWWTSFNAFTKLEPMRMHEQAHGTCHHNFLQLYLLKNELEKLSLRPRLSIFFNPAPCNRCNLCFQIRKLATAAWRRHPDANVAQLVQVPRVESIGWKIF